MRINGYGAYRVPPVVRTAESGDRPAQPNWQQPKATAKPKPKGVGQSPLHWYQGNLCDEIC